jgi:cell division protein FtsB
MVVGHLMRPRRRRLGQATSKRFTSLLLIAYGAGAAGVDAVDVEGMKLQIMGLASANKSLEARVMKVERQLAALIANK